MAATPNDYESRDPIPMYHTIYDVEVTGPEKTTAEHLALIEHDQDTFKEADTQDGDTFKEFYDPDAPTTSSNLFGRQDDDIQYLASLPAQAASEEYDGRDAAVAATSDAKSTTSGTNNKLAMPSGITRFWTRTRRPSESSKEKDEEKAGILRKKSAPALPERRRELQFSEKQFSSVYLNSYAAEGKANLSKLWGTTRLSPKTNKHWELLSRELEQSGASTTLRLDDDDMSSGASSERRINVIADTAHDSLYNVQWTLASAGLDMNKSYGFRALEADDSVKLQASFLLTSSTIRQSAHGWTNFDRTRAYTSDAIVAIVWLPLRKDAMTILNNHLQYSTSHKKVPIIVVAFHTRQGDPQERETNDKAAVKLQALELKDYCRRPWFNPPDSVWAYFEMKNGDHQTVSNVVRAALLASIANRE